MPADQCNRRQRKREKQVRKTVRIGLALFVGIISYLMYLAIGFQWTSLREFRLVAIINQHTGFAHLVRGMNACTAYALYSNATRDDLPVLINMLHSQDHVIRLTVMETMAAMGEDVQSLLPANVSPSERMEANDAIQNVKKYGVPTPRRDCP